MQTTGKKKRTVGRWAYTVAELGSPRQAEHNSNLASTVNPTVRFRLPPDPFYTLLNIPSSERTKIFNEFMYSEGISELCIL